MIEEVVKKVKKETNVKKIGKVKKEKGMKITNYEFNVNSNGYGCKIKKLNEKKEMKQFVSLFTNEFSLKCNKYIDEYKEKQPRFLLGLLVNEIELQFSSVEQKPAIGFDSLKYWLKNGIGMKMEDHAFNNIFKWNLLEKGFKSLQCIKRIRSERLIIIVDLWEYKRSI